jgi:hypothetical protein
MGTPVPVAFAKVIREQTTANMGKFSLGLSLCLYSVEKAKRFKPCKGQFQFFYKWGAVAIVETGISRCCSKLK